MSANTMDEIDQHIDRCHSAKQRRFAHAYGAHKQRVDALMARHHPTTVRDDVHALMTPQDDVHETDANATTTRDSDDVIHTDPLGDALKTTNQQRKDRTPEAVKKSLNFDAVANRSNDQPLQQTAASSKEVVDDSGANSNVTRAKTTGNQKI